MAGVYPVGMKLASTWARGDMGLMVGILVGVLPRRTWAFAPLAIGPAIGVWAMARLRAHPRAMALAGGRR